MIRILFLLGFVLILFLLGFAFIGCASAKRAAIVTSYEAELDQCLLKGHEANSRRVYDDCADNVDVRFGLLRDGGAGR